MSGGKRKPPRCAVNKAGKGGRCTRSATTVMHSISRQYTGIFVACSQHAKVARDNGCCWVWSTSGEYRCWAKNIRRFDERWPNGIKGGPVAGAWDTDDDEA
jgi:hypothetical protein